MDWPIFLKYKTKTTTFKSLVLATLITQHKFLKLKSRHEKTLIFVVFVVYRLYVCVCKKKETKSKKKMKIKQNK